MLTQEKIEKLQNLGFNADHVKAVEAVSASNRAEADEVGAEFKSLDETVEETEVEEVEEVATEDTSEEVEGDAPVLLTESRVQEMISEALEKNNQEQVEAIGKAVVGSIADLRSDVETLVEVQKAFITNATETLAPVTLQDVISKGLSAIGDNGSEVEKGDPLFNKAPKADPNYGIFAEGVSVASSSDLL